MRKRINPKTDACKRGHVGHWGQNGAWICCRMCQRIKEARFRQAGRSRMLALNLAYQAIPGAIKRAGSLLHLHPVVIRKFLNGARHAPRWRVTQLKAVLELCIMTNGNGHKSSAGYLPPSAE